MKPYSFLQGIDAGKLPPEAENYLREEILKSEAIGQISPDAKEFKNVVELITSRYPDALPKGESEKEVKGVTKEDYQKAIKGLAASIKYLPAGDKKKTQTAIKGLKIAMKYQKMEKGGFFDSLKKYTKKGYEGAKKGYKKAEKYTKEKIHDKKKQIAIDVLDETRDKIASNDKVPEKTAVKAMSHISKALNIVETEYNDGGKINFSGHTFKTNEEGVVKEIRNFYTQKMVEEFNLNGVIYTRNYAYKHYNSPTNEILQKSDIIQNSK